MAVAAHNGHLDVVEELIQNGAYINETNKNGKLALFFFLPHKIIKRGCYWSFLDLRGKEGVVFSQNPKNEPNLNYLINNFIFRVDFLDFSFNGYKLTFSLEVMNYKRLELDKLGRGSDRAHLF